MGVSLPLKTSSPQAPIRVAQAERLKAHVSFMSEIQPARNYQNLKSLDAVGTYIEKHFKKAGLEPARQYFKVETIPILMFMLFGVIPNYPEWLSALITM